MTVLKSSIDIELEKGIEVLDTVDAYKWALICSEHALTEFNMNGSSVDKALQTINNNLDNVSIEMAKAITKSLIEEANVIESNLPLHYMILSLAHTVAVLVDKKHTIYAAIYAANAILEKSKKKEMYEAEKLYQLEKLNKFLIMYEN